MRRKAPTQPQESHSIRLLLCRSTRRLYRGQAGTPALEDGAIPSSSSRIPLARLGGILALIITGTPFSVSAGGFIRAVNIAVMGGRDRTAAGGAAVPRFAPRRSGARNRRHRRCAGHHAAYPRSATGADLPVPPQAAPPGELTHYMRNTPNCAAAGIGAFSEAAIPSASALRVSTGSSTPSSHRRALE